MLQSRRLKQQIFNKRSEIVNDLKNVATKIQELKVLLPNHTFKIISNTTSGMLITTKSADEYAQLCLHNISTNDLITNENLTFFTNFKKTTTRKPINKICKEWKLANSLTHNIYTLTEFNRVTTQV